MTNNFKPYSESTVRDHLSSAHYIDTIHFRLAHHLWARWLWSVGNQLNFKSGIQPDRRSIIVLLVSWRIHFRKDFINGCCSAMYYRGAAAAIVVYDITRQNTFKTLKNWVDELRSQGPKDIAIAIAGNKADLEDRRVSIFSLIRWPNYPCACYFRKLQRQLQ